MALTLSDFEASPRAGGDYDAALAALRRRLAQAQVAHIVHGRRAIVVFEGWAASGRGGTIQRLAAALDPRMFRVWPIAAPSAEERVRHYLARFWAKLPATGEIAVFDGSWYGRVMGERVEGLVSKPEWKRGYDEINEFEAQQKDSGTTLVKLFLHVSEAEQARRIQRRLADPWKRSTLTHADLAARSRRTEHVAAIEEMLARTDTRWAPWRVIDAGSRKYARLAALGHIADVLEKAVPMPPPAMDEAMLAAAREAGFPID